MTLLEAAELKKGYEVSGTTVLQKIGVDMFVNLMRSYFYLSGNTRHVY